MDSTIADYRGSRRIQEVIFLPNPRVLGKGTPFPPPFPSRDRPHSRDLLPTHRQPTSALLTADRKRLATSLPFSSQSSPSAGEAPPIFPLLPTMKAHSVCWYESKIIGFFLFLNSTHSSFLVTPIEDQRAWPKQPLTVARALVALKSESQALKCVPF